MIEVQDFLHVGQHALAQKIVQESDTAGGYSCGLNNLLATPVLFDMVLRAAAEAVDKKLPEGYISVGQLICLVHDMPSPLGAKVKVKATLVEMHSRQLLFDILAWDEQGYIAHGHHERIVTNRAELLRRAEYRVDFGRRHVK